MQASLQTGWWREENWVLPILILASATLLLLLLFQVTATFLLLLTQTWNAGSAVGQINQGQGQQQVRLTLIPAVALVFAVFAHILVHTLSVLFRYLY